MYFANMLDSLFQKLKEITSLYVTQVVKYNHLTT